MWTLAAMIKHINLVTDESFNEDEVRGFINDGIAQINVYMSANFPYINPLDTEYTALSEKWQRQLFVPYAAARIKQNDSSQFEYNDWYGQYSENIIEFRSRFIVPDEYKDPSDLDVPLQDVFTDGGSW
jgi:hypothetical protein